MRNRNFPLLAAAVVAALYLASPAAMASGEATPAAPSADASTAGSAMQNRH
jgi:hypothetical protein